MLRASVLRDSPRKGQRRRAWPARPPRSPGLAAPSAWIHGGPVAGGLAPLGGGGPAPHGHGPLCNVPRGTPATCSAGSGGLGTLPRPTRAGHRAGAIACALSLLALARRSARPGRSLRASLRRAGPGPSPGGLTPAEDTDPRRWLPSLRSGLPPSPGPLLNATLQQCPPGRLPLSRVSGHCVRPSTRFARAAPLTGRRPG